MNEKMNKMAFFIFPIFQIINTNISNNKFTDSKGLEKEMKIVRKTTENNHPLDLKSNKLRTKYPFYFTTLILNIFADNRIEYILIA